MWEIKRWTQRCLFSSSFWFASFTHQPSQKLHKVGGERRCMILRRPCSSFISESNILLTSNRVSCYKRCWALKKTCSNRFREFVTLTCELQISTQPQRLHLACVVSLYKLTTVLTFWRTFSFYQKNKQQRFGNTKSKILLCLLSTKTQKVIGCRDRGGSNTMRQAKVKHRKHEDKGNTGERGGLIYTRKVTRHRWD